MGLTWYLAPRFYRAEDHSDPDPANWVDELESPGTGNPLVSYEGMGKPYRSLCYDSTAGTCLVGFDPSAGVDPGPSDWVKKTLAEAITIYEKFFSSQVTAITGAKIAVTDSVTPRFQVGQTVRIWSQDELTTESFTITDITQGTGPGGEDEIIVNVINNTYSPSTETVTLGRTPPTNEVF